MIEVKNLVKKFGDHIAVDNISFNIEKGHIYGLLGPNGAGKSTTMNMVTGYIAATSGEIIINGHDIFEEPNEAKKSIGYLPEQPPVYMDMTVLEYLQFSAELKGIKKDARANMIDEIMELTKVTDVKGRLIKNLSKGYRQRVGLAQAILGYPDVIILDEPTVGLDPKQIIEIRDLIKKLGEKHTVILSSHILSEVSAVCDYIMIISKGKLVASDKTVNLGNMMETSEKVNMTVKAADSEIKAVLNHINIVDYEISKSAEPDCFDVIVNVSGKEDIREKLFFGFADIKKPVIVMNSSKMSLEDVFLELTSENEVKEESEEDADNESNI